MRRRHGPIAAASGKISAREETAKGGNTTGGFINPKAKRVHRMNCKEFQRIVIDLVRHSGTDVPAPGVMEHSEQCAECRSKLTEQLILTLRFRQLAAETADPKIPERIDESVYAAFERTHSRPVRSHRQTVIWAGVAAAVLALVFIKPGRVEERISSERAPHEQTQFDVAKDAIGALDTQPQSETLRTPTREVTVPAVNRMPNEFREFIPLGLSVAPRAAGPVIRVELSGAVLHSLGFPISGDLYDRRIQADLMLGEDGLAQAIRFVP